MRERERLREQLEVAWTGPAWHGPALGEVLAGVGAEQAAMRPLPGRHSIWEIVLHLTTWLEVGRLRASGRDQEPTPAEDWPRPPDTTSAAWEDARARLESAHLALLELLGAMDEGRLDEAAAGRDYSVGFLLHGVVQHYAYHAGQIVLLKAATA